MILSIALVLSKRTPLAERSQTSLSKYSRVMLTRPSSSSETPFAIASSMRTNLNLPRKKLAKSMKKMITDISRPPLKMLTSMFTETT
jgi:hypothetical protein